MESPQLLLAAQVDEENNVVFFRGLLTGEEFEALISKRLNSQKEINLSIDQFDGGIDRLLRFVRLLEPSAIPRTSLVPQSNAEWSWDPIKKQMLPASHFACDPASLATQCFLVLQGSFAHFQRAVRR